MKLQRYEPMTTCGTQGMMRGYICLYVLNPPLSCDSGVTAQFFCKTNSKYQMLLAYLKRSIRGTK